VLSIQNAAYAKATIHVSCSVSMYGLATVHEFGIGLVIEVLNTTYVISHP